MAGKSAKPSSIRTSLTRPSLSQSASPKTIASRIVAIEPRFQAVVDFAGPSPIGRSPRRESNFASLATSILSQQLSTKAAATIISRVEVASGGISPARISKISSRTLKSCGVSGAKVRALKELAAADREYSFSRLHQIKDDDEIFARLLPIFGVGKWTVEMFLIFQLGRADIWPTGDLGVRRGFEQIHQMRSEITPKELERRGEIFRPWRSHVAWYCWRAIDMSRS